MSSNITRSSTGVPSSDLPTVKEVKGLNAEQLNGFLKKKLNNIDNHIDTLTAQEFNGSNFFDLTQNDLMSIQIPLGPAKKIIKLINDIQEVKPSLKFGSETVNLVRTIGIGKTSIVYEGKYHEKSVVVKMAKKVEYFPCIVKENDALKELSRLNSPHIPQIIFSNEDTLVMTPLGEKINNLQMKDIKNIINTFKEVHSLGFIHRDLRKCNFIRDQNENIVVIDWGYSIKQGNGSFAGALESMPDDILRSIIDEDDDCAYGPEVDLVCLVRSLYLMLHRPPLDRIVFDKDDNIKNKARAMLKFWSNCRDSDLWNDIYGAIDMLDYDQLIQQLGRLF